jgi:hypothetical protein
MNDWPFEDPPNVATITVKQIMDGRAPILLVCRDEEDGSWQFLTGGPFEMGDALVVSLESVVRRDTSLRELAGLPCGWRARRASGEAPWVREPDEDEDGDGA